MLDQRGRVGVTCDGTWAKATLSSTKRLLTANVQEQELFLKNRI